MRHMVALVAVVFLAGACQPPDRVRVGLIDAAKLIQGTPQGKKVRLALRKEENRLNSKLMGHKLRMRQLALEIKTLSEQKPPDQAKIRAKRVLIQQEVTKLREKHTLLEAELQKAAKKLLEAFRKDVEQVAKKVALREGLDLMIYRSKSSGLWIWPTTDVTDKVIEKMDAESGE